MVGKSLDQSFAYKDAVIDAVQPRAVKSPVLHSLPSKTNVEAAGPSVHMRKSIHLSDSIDTQAIDSKYLIIPANVIWGPYMLEMIRSGRYPTTPGGSNRRESKQRQNITTTSIINGSNCVRFGIALAAPNLPQANQERNIIGHVNGIARDRVLVMRRTAWKDGTDAPRRNIDILQHRPAEFHWVKENRAASPHQDLHRDSVRGNPVRNAYAVVASIRTR